MKTDYRNIDIREYRRICEIANEINAPGSLDIFFPLYRGEPVEGRTDCRNAGLVAGLDGIGFHILGYEITKRVGYRWMPLSVNRTLLECSRSEVFRDKLAAYKIVNWEVIINKGNGNGIVIVKPPIERNVLQDNSEGSRFRYSGKEKHVDLDSNDVVTTLQNAGAVAKYPGIGMLRGGIFYNEPMNKGACVSSFYLPGDGGLVVTGRGVGYKHENSVVAAYMKV